MSVAGRGRGAGGVTRGRVGRYGKTKVGLAKDWGVTTKEAEATINAWCGTPACACGQGCKAPA